jgi:type III pantothenate kinase
MLLFDVGNTRIKWGVLDDGRLTRTGAVTHESLRERGMETLTRRLPRRVDGALACNVAGAAFGSRLARAIGIHIGGDLRYVRSEQSAGGLENGYHQPRSLGADRWFAMLGARAEFGGALCVVDAGTAVTIDAIDPSGQHLGGQIIPGLRLLATALATDTSDIGKTRRQSISFDSPADLFGRSTAAAVACGSVNAICGAVERAAGALRQMSLEPRVVLTGGDASRILPGLAGVTEHRPHLVLQGLAHTVMHDP